VCRATTGYADGRGCLLVLDRLRRLGDGKLAISAISVVFVVVVVVKFQPGSNKCGVGPNSIESWVRRGGTQHKQHDSQFDRGSIDWSAGE
jgi:hypothetical protein